MNLTTHSWLAAMASSPETIADGLGALDSDFLIVRADFLMLAKAGFDLLVEEVAHVLIGLQALDHDDKFRLVRRGAHQDP